MGGQNSKPQPNWSVQSNNWKSNVQSIIDDFVANGGDEGLIVDPQRGATQVYVPISFTNDPAEGCPKEFTSQYTCGTSSTRKDIFLPAEADGKWAAYTCTDEDNKCTRAVLEIRDTGEVVLRSSNNSETFWNSGPNKTGLPISTFSAANSKYGRNFLAAGETLAVGEWVGSPSGNCYLTVVSDGSNSKLVVAYQELACTPQPKDGVPTQPVCNIEYKALPNQNMGDALTGGGGPADRYNYNNLEAAQKQCNAMDNCKGITRDGYGFNLRGGGPSPWTGMNSWQKEKVCTAPPGPVPVGYGEDGYVTSTPGMNAVYSMSDGYVKNDFAGKIGYSDVNMHRHLYPSNMVHSGQDFIQLAGNFTQKDGIEKTMAGDFDECKTECNNMDHCEGIITSKDSSGAPQCTILKTAYPNTGRIADTNGSTLYVRKKNVDNPMTCSSTVTQTYGKTFQNQVEGAGMTPKTKCSLGKMTAEQQKILNAANKKLLQETGVLNNKLTNLNKENAVLDQDMLNSIAQIQKDTVDYEKVQKETRVLKKEINNAGAMEESSGLDMISNNMQLVMFTALGAAAVIGTIKATK